MNEFSKALSIESTPTLFLVNQGNSLYKIEGNPTKEKFDELIEDINLISKV